MKSPTHNLPRAIGFQWGDSLLQYFKNLAMPFLVTSIKKIAFGNQTLSIGIYYGLQWSRVTKQTFQWFSISLDSCLILASSQKGRTYLLMSHLVPIYIYLSISVMRLCRWIFTIVIALTCSLLCFSII